MNPKTFSPLQQAAVPRVRAALPDGGRLEIGPVDGPHEVVAEWWQAGAAVPRVRLSGPALLTPAGALQFAEAVGQVEPKVFTAALETGVRVLTLMVPGEAAESAVHNEAAAPEPKSRPLRAILADPEALRPPAPLIPRLCWRERLTVYPAVDKSGKSTLTTAAVAAFTAGRPFLGQRCGPGVAVWLMAEEHVSDLTQRAVRFGADPDRLHVMEFPANPRADLWEVVQALRPDVVVVDPLIRYAGDSVTESGQAAQWRPVMGDLLRVAREGGAGVVLLHHARKSDGRSRDSGDITAAADVVLEQLERHAEGKQTLKVRGRWAMEDFTVVLTGDEYRLDVAGDAPTPVRVLEYLRLNPGAGKSQVRRGVSGGTGAVDAALTDLLRRGLVVDGGSGNAHRYRLAQTPGSVDPANWGSQGQSQGDSRSHLTPATPVSQGVVRVESGLESGSTCLTPQPIGLRESDESGDAREPDLFPGGANTFDPEDL